MSRLGFCLTLLILPGISVRRDTRLYTCLQLEIEEPTDCRLTFTTAEDELVTLTDSGCFVERGPDQLLKTLCPLQCPDYAGAVLREVRPAGLCHEGVGIVRRRRDWFLWRSHACSLVEAQFDVECGGVAQSAAAESAEQPFDATGLDLEGSGRPQ